MRTSVFVAITMFAGCIIPVPVAAPPPAQPAYQAPADGSAYPQSTGYGSAPNQGPVAASSSRPNASPRSAPPLASPPRSAPPPAPSVVSVTIRSACSKSATVFYGDKPGFSSGTTSSISSNSVTSKSFKPGDLMWLVDGSGRGIASVSISDRTRNIEINASCTGLSAR